VADASNLFDVTFKSSERIEVGCNMQARRGFVKALDAGDLRASAHRRLQGAVRRRSGLRRRGPRDAATRAATKIQDGVRRASALEPPRSMLGTAVQYLVNRWVVPPGSSATAVPIGNGSMGAAPLPIRPESAPTASRQRADFEVAESPSCPLSPQLVKPEPSSPDSTPPSFTPPFS
jgi:hypothetical protein